ncbi:hypothetical protein BDV93DRAFT_403884, partial [Ceratobasidium sp. AG-I]
DALKIFDALCPSCVGVFLFDQSSAHGAFAENALVAKQMHVGHGGKGVKLIHDTKIPMDNPNPALRGKPQPVVFPEGHKFAGQPKGMKVVLRERGQLETLDCNQSGNPVGVCTLCKQLIRRPKSKWLKIRNSTKDTGLDEERLDPVSKSTCCMLCCLSAQQDFLDKKPKIQILIEGAGHKCIFLPKFHCELNPIEMYWGYAKR